MVRNKLRTLRFTPTLTHEALVSTADLLRYFVKPHLVHGRDPHDGKTHAHQATGNQHHPRKAGINLGEIPGAHIGRDTQKWHEHHRAFHPHGPHPGMTENEAKDEKDKRNTKQVNMGNPYQRVQIGAGILGDDGLHVIEPIEIG